MLPCCIILALIFVSYWGLRDRIRSVDRKILSALGLIANEKKEGYEMEQWTYLFGKPVLTGEITLKHRRKAWLVYLLFAFLGLIPTLYKAPFLLQLAGLGIITPGGAFLGMGSVLGFILTLVLLLVSLFFWWATGNMIGPFFVWAASDALAVLLARNMTAVSRSGFIAVLVLPAVYFLIGRIHAQVSKVRQKKKQKAINEEMPKNLEKLHALQIDAPTTDELELSDLALGSQAYLMDQAFAPYGEFRGFDVIEQFQPSAVRYQINAMLNAMQMVQCHYTPNYHGPNTEAQRKLIELFQHPLVWSYWEKEEAWGNLRRNADPIPKRDNIMLTGFFLPNVTMYTKNTGDLTYEERGSITFRKNDKKVFPHSVHTIAESIIGNWESRDYTVYPCEPNWIYSICNWKAITGIISYDATFGTTYWKDHKEKVLQKYRDEMLDMTGAPALFRSSRTSWAPPAINMPLYDSFFSMLYNTASTDWADSLWALKRDGFLKQQEDGTYTVSPGIGFDHGNYSAGHLDAIGGLLMAAGEMGDEAVRDACYSAMTEEGNYTVNGEGLIRWNCSNEANAQCLSGLAGFRNAWRDAVCYGPKPETFEGPLLEQIDYKKVWVAKAISKDGKSLDLVLKNAVDRYAGEHTIGLDRLVPNATYKIAEDGRVFTATEEGTAEIAVNVDGRTPVTIVPAA